MIDPIKVTPKNVEGPKNDQVYDLCFKLVSFYQELLEQAKEDDEIENLWQQS